MNFLQRASILIEARKNRKQIEHNHEAMRNVSVAKWLTLTSIQPKTGDFPLTPKYRSELEKRLVWIEDYKINKSHESDDTVLVGDSLADFTREQLTTVDTRLNLALAGQASSFYDAILRDTYETLGGLNIQYLIIECWGNELLSYYDIETVKFHVARTINRARLMYPSAKLILVGLPPTYDVYVNTVKIEFTNHLINLVNQDANACLVLLEKHFSGAFGIFPKLEYSSDGVHFSGNGILLFDKLLQQAKTTLEKVIGY